MSNSSVAVLLKSTENYFTAQEAAKKLGVSSNTVRNWSKDGKICNAVKNGRNYLIPKSAINPNEKFYTAREAANLLGLHLDTIQDWCNRGKIRTLKYPGSDFRIPTDEIMRFAEKPIGLKTFTPDEVASLLGVSARTVHKWCNTGKVRTLDCIPRPYQIPEDEVERLSALLDEKAAKQQEYVSDCGTAALLNLNSRKFRKWCKHSDINTLQKQAEHKSTRETAELLGVCQETVQNWCKNGNINSSELPDHRLRIPTSEVAQRLENHLTLAEFGKLFGVTGKSVKRWCDEGKVCEGYRGERGQIFIHESEVERYRELYFIKRQVKKK